MDSHEVHLPERWSERIDVDGNSARQLLTPAMSGRARRAVGVAAFADLWEAGALPIERSTI